MKEGGRCVSEEWYDTGSIKDRFKEDDKSKVLLLADGTAEGHGGGSRH